MANGRDAGQDVAAVLLRGHFGLVHPDLAEEVVDVDAGPRRSARRWPPCWSADPRRRRRRSDVGPATPSPPAAHGRAWPYRREDPRRGSRHPSTCPLASACRQSRSASGFAGPGVVLDRGRAVGVEALHGLESPRLALLPLGLGPDHGLPVGRQHQAGARVVHLDAVAARLDEVEEERLLHGVLVGPGLDLDRRAPAQMSAARSTSSFESSAQVAW